MAQQEGIASVLFADIVDSSRLYSEMGDSVARRTVLECLDVMAEAVEGAQGHVVERIGDEVMAVFDSAGASVEASIRLQKAVDDARTGDRLPEDVQVRVGFHCGPLLRDGDKVFGSTVYVARRLASLAKGHQILTTTQALRSLPDGASTRTRSLGPTRVKGQTEDFELLEIIWDPRRATFNEPPAWAPAPSLALSVRLGEEERTIDASRPVLTIGRDASCDLVVPHEKVSRLHARIELRKSGFVLIDLSTNGTFVNVDDRSTLVHRDDAALEGRGTIRLGSRDAGDADVRDLVFFPVDRG